MEEKKKLAWEDPRSNRGYVAPGRERVTQETDTKKIAEMRIKSPDAKETMEIGRDWDKTWKNQWPKEELVPGFKQTFLSFFKICHELHTEVMRSIAIGLHLEETYFDDKIQEQVGASDPNLAYYSRTLQYHNLRLLSYPPIRTDLLKEDGQARAGVHSDYGTLTFVVSVVEMPTGLFSTNHLSVSG
jgi:isopenicillin N synthase-like dioxygenase